MNTKHTMSNLTENEIIDGLRSYTDKCVMIDNIFYLEIDDCPDKFSVKFIESNDKTVHCDQHGNELILSSSWYISTNDKPFVHTHNIYCVCSVGEDMIEILNGQPEEFDTIREIVEDYIYTLDSYKSTKETGHLVDLVHTNTSIEVEEFTVKKIVI
jgi:hypothetical protein